MPNDTTSEINAQLSALQVQNFEMDENGETAEHNYPYVIIQLFENRFAINCKYVVSIEQVSKTTELVNSSHEFRGISYYKNEPISIYDLRRLFGIMSSDEFINHVVDVPGRVMEHEIIVGNLRDCAMSGMPYEEDTDPHKCAFGRWLNEYKNKASNLEVRKQLLKIDPIHDKFHRIAKSIKDFINRGSSDESPKYLEELEVVKDELARDLYELHDILVESAMELNVVLQLKGKKIGIIVDSAESVEAIDEIQELPPSVSTTKYIRRLGLSKKEKQIIFILEAKEFGDY